MKFPDRKSRSRADLTGAAILFVLTRRVTSRGDVTAGRRRQLYKLINKTQNQLYKLMNKTQNQLYKLINKTQNQLYKRINKTQKQL